METMLNVTTTVLPFLLNNNIVRTALGSLVNGESNDTLRDVNITTTTAGTVLSNITSGVGVTISNDFYHGNSTLGVPGTLDFNLTTTELPCLNTTNSTIEESTTTMNSRDRDLQDFMIGLTLAVGSSIFIGSSFILKKLGLLKYARKVSLRAGAGGFGYLREWTWWAGMILMTVGEFANFAAYAFAPATMVTPLGALSVIVSAVLAARILKEKLNILGKVGCFLCVVGSTVMVIHAPKEQEVHDVEELMNKMKEPAFIVYAIGIMIISVVAIIYFAPRYGQKNVLVYITICATLGSFTVMGCKGVGTAIKATARGHNEFKNWLTYALLAVVILCILLQLNYLNKALDTFNTAVVTPIYYVFFTSTVILGSAILFQEFFSMDALDIIGDLCGFLTIVAGIFLLNAFKDLKVTWRNLPSVTKDGKEAEADGDMANGTIGFSGVANSNYMVDCRDIEAHIERNLSTECITRTMSSESDCNDNGFASDRYQGSSPVQEL